MPGLNTPLLPPGVFPFGFKLLRMIVGGFPPAGCFSPDEKKRELLPCTDWGCFWGLAIGLKLLIRAIVLVAPEFEFALLCPYGKEALAPPPVGVRKELELEWLYCACDASKDVDVSSNDESNPGVVVLTRLYSFIRNPLRSDRLLPPLADEDDEENGNAANRKSQMLPQHRVSNSTISSSLSID